MFYLSIENSPKFTTKNIGVMAVNGDCANFHKKVCNSATKKKNLGYLRLRLQISNSFQTKKRRQTVLHPKTFSI